MIARDKRVYKVLADFLRYFFVHHLHQCEIRRFYGLFVCGYLSVVVRLPRWPFTLGPLGDDPAWLTEQWQHVIPIE